MQSEIAERAGMTAFDPQLGRVVSRAELLDQVWGVDWLGDTRTLDVHIRMIRRGIEDDPSRPRFVRTVRGRGYVFQVPELEPNL